MYTKIRAAKIKICKLKNKLKKQTASIKAAGKLTSNLGMLNFLENCSASAKLLIKMQCRENAKKQKGRRFTIQEKILALSIWKQSPKGYKLLRRIFILPAPQTLVKLIQMSNIKPGVNENIFFQLKKKADSMKDQQKLCIIMFDEMSLKPSLTYHSRKDRLVGVADNGKKRMPEFADHAQVFMLRGLIYNYKQPISYTFSHSATKGAELCSQIKDIIKKIQECGLIVVALVCDQGTNNRQAIKMLVNETRGVYLRSGKEIKENIILINNQEIIPLYDPPHLLKGMRNNLITKNLSYNMDGVQKIAKWSHLQLLYKENPGYKGIRLMPKLTENHINPDKMNKMKVKFASQLFSRTVASNMGYLADKGILPAECRDTADLMYFLDNIFDSVNGSRNKNIYAKPLLGPAKINSVHNKIWTEGIKTFKTMKFINDSGKSESVPTLENWVWTLNGIKVLLTKLRSEFDISSVWLRHLNQDPLENFFGAVRSHGCRNVNPNCDQFESAFATLLINNLNSVRTQGTNCEEDSCDALHTLIVSHDEQPTSTGSFDFQSIIDLSFTPMDFKEKDPRIIAPIQYISGYVLKKLQYHVFKSCTICKCSLFSKNEIEYIKYREYAGRRWLCTPSNGLIDIISKIQDIFSIIIKEHVVNDDIKVILKTAILLLIDFEIITCRHHRDKLINYLISIVIRCFLFNYCKNVNQILAGKREVDDADPLQIKAQKIYKCYKRRRYIKIQHPRVPSS